MKGFFKWFKSNTRIKRWIVMILIGVVLACYGIAKVITATSLESILDIALIIVSFAIGFSLIVIGLVFSYKRVLEILIESTDSRLIKGSKHVNVKSLIFDKTVYDKGPKVVVIGGGAGLNSVLKGMKKYTDSITAIVPVTNYGELSSTHKSELSKKSLDGIKENIVALSENEELLQKVFDLAIEKTGTTELTFGDLYLLAMNEVCNNSIEAIEKNNEVLNIKGRILPVTLDKVRVCAELDDGRVVEDRDKIPQAVFEKMVKIKRVFLTPSNCMPAPGVIDAINNADAIIMGPGSLYTDIIPSLLVKNVTRTIRDSKAIKVYFSNIMTEPGQTDNYTLSEHIDALLEHIGKDAVDYCVYDSGEVIPEYIKRYNKGGSDLIELDIQKAKSKGVRLIQKDLACIENDKIRHNPSVIGETMIELICDDMKFRDKKNDPQYLMLTNKLKEEKRIERAKRRNNSRIGKNKKASAANSKKNSKFKSKYSERIQSIKISDQKIKDKMKKEQLKQEEMNKLKMAQSADSDNEDYDMIEKEILEAKKAAILSKKPVVRTTKKTTTKKAATVKKATVKKATVRSTKPISAKRAAPKKRKITDDE